MDNLITTETFCQGLLLPAGQKHSNRENVFQVNTVIPGLRNRNGSYPTTEHRSQPGDTNVQADSARGSSRDVSDVQQWVEGTDYNIESNEKIVLMLRYMYNKMVAQGTFMENQATELLWIFRYFWLSSDQAQIYYLPVSTCRYPNQIAKILVYPDMEWEVSFIISTGETHTLSGGAKDNLINFPANHGLKFTDKFQFKSKYKGFSFATNISTKVNGNKYSVGFDKIENLIKALGDLKEFLDKFDSSKSTKASAGGFTEYFSFKLVSPNLALAFKWNNGNIIDSNNSNKVVTMLTGALKLAPLIGINFEVDLFIITDNIKVYGIGPITEFIREAIEWVTETDIYILAYVNVELKGEFTIVYNSINGFDEKKSNNKAILNIPFGIKGGVKSDEENAIILPSGEKMDKFKAEFSINSGIEIIEELGTDNEGPYKKNSYIYSGLNVKVVIVENVFSRKKLSIIPKFDDTFEVLKRKDICPAKKEYLKN